MSDDFRIDDDGIADALKNCNRLEFGHVYDGDTDFARLVSGPMGGVFRVANLKGYAYEMAWDDALAMARAILAFEESKN